MSWIATAVIGGAVVGAGASIYASNKSSDAIVKSTEQATKTQTEASDKAIDTELQMFYQGREDTAPWRIAGQNALNKLIPMVEQGPGEFVPENDPGYKFGYSEFVENPTLKNASASGRLRSGATQKALTRYAQDYASTKYDNHLARFYDSLKPYQTLANVGQVTASNNANNALSTGQSIGNNYLATGQMVGGNALAAGSARSSGYANAGNIISNTAGGLGQNALDYYYMNKFLPKAG